MFKARILGFALAFVGGFSLLAAQSPAQVSAGNHPAYPGGYHRFPSRTIGEKHDGSGKIQPNDGLAGTAMCFGDGTGAKCPDNNYGPPGRGCMNSALTGGLLAGNGVPKVSKDSLHFEVSGLPDDSTAIFLQARNLQTGVAFGQGLLCIRGAVSTIAVKRTAYGATSYPQYLDEPICDKGKVPSFGATVYYQVLYRDEEASHNEKNHFNLSNAWMTVWTP